MVRLDELRETTADMTAPDLLRYLLFEKFPKKCAITASLRIRSVVVLDMVAAIEPSTPVVFCHAPYVYAESVEYRARIVRRLGLTDVHDPENDENGVLPGDQDHHEEIRTSVWGGGTVETITHLNRSLAAVDCWISAAYHRPYADDATPRLSQEGRLLRVDPLSGWTRQEVLAYAATHNLPRHPRIVAPTYHY